MNQKFRFRVENLMTGSTIVVSELVGMTTRNEVVNAFDDGQCFVVVSTTGERYYFDPSSGYLVLRVQTVDED